MVAGLLASSAQAQTLGNPPGNTVAPATGSVTTAPGPAPTATGGDMVAPGTPVKVAANKYKTEMVCKTSVETGSLIAKKKTCLTRKQWQYVNDENQRDAYKFVQDNTTKPGGN